ncbi:MAG: hypothetical protein ACYC96_06310 [Fimbriimonadaceae bacterium]
MSNEPLKINTKTILKVIAAELGILAVACAERRFNERGRARLRARIAEIDQAVTSEQWSKALTLVANLTDGILAVGATPPVSPPAQTPATPSLRTS